MNLPDEDPAADDAAAREACSKWPASASHATRRACKPAMLDRRNARKSSIVAPMTKSTRESEPTGATGPSRLLEPTRAESRLPELAERLAELARARPIGDHAGDAAKRRTTQLRDHLPAHVLPRARSLDAPLLVLLIGPTGAGKSSLLNALAGFAASPSGVTTADDP